MLSFTSLCEPISVSRAMKIWIYETILSPIPMTSLFVMFRLFLSKKSFRLSFLTLSITPRLYSSISRNLRSDEHIYAKQVFLVIRKGYLTAKSSLSDCCSPLISSYTTYAPRHCVVRLEIKSGYTGYVSITQTYSMMVIRDRYQRNPYISIGIGDAMRWVSREVYMAWIRHNIAVQMAVWNGLEK